MGTRWFSPWWTGSRRLPISSLCLNYRLPERQRLLSLTTFFAFMVSRQTVVSDRGPQFVSKFWSEFCRLLGATVSLSSGYHPQSNGQTERANQDLERMLRCVVSQNPSSWSQQLSWVEYAHNSLPVSGTGLSPFEGSLGYQPPIFSSLESEVAVPSAHAFVQRCRRTWSRARQTLLQVGARTKAKADRHRSRPPVYVVGQKVWLSS